MKIIRLKCSNVKFTFFALSISTYLPAKGFCDEYYFDSSLFKGSAFGQNLEKFNASSTPAGNYLVDIYLNNQLIKSGVKINFTAANAGNKSEPCIPDSIAKLMQIKAMPDGKNDDQCHPLSWWVKTGKWEFDQSSLRLQLMIPMADLQRTPRGYIPAAEWDDGMTALFIRHNTNYTWTENPGTGYSYQYLWSGITAGTNIANWQFRHQGNLRYLQTSSSGSSYRYNAVKTWVQRPLESINSLMSIGDNYTESSLFGSLSFNGIKLATDERMWPQGRRGYAPEVRGVASSNARVVIKQLNKVIYETTVPPGPFVINDLYNTRSQGDLAVEVIEANGKTSTFTVPYSSVPDSVRPGNWHYSLALGRVRQYYSVDNAFFEGILQKGISNRLTATAGSRLAKDYQAWLLGGVLATEAGALGVNTTFSDAKAEQNKNVTGWRAEVSYSKTFQTGTNLVLAAYRYSTSGFRDLEDVLGVRRQNQSGVSYYSDTLHQRNRLSATLSQSFDGLGMVSLNASTADYYNNQSRITQLQMGYSNTWKKISYSFNVARQRTSYNYDRYNVSVNDSDDDSSKQKYTENTVSLNISIPLNWGNNLSSVAYNYNQSKETRSSTVSLTGSAGQNRDFSYSVYAGTDQDRTDGNSNSTTFGGSVQQNTRVGNFRANYGQGSHYRQAGLGASGTILIHSGGVTLGPYTSDTFALIHADGAQGAAVRNGQGAVVDSFGYAILPSLTPYRANTVSLDTLNMSSDAELSGGSQRVVPYAGAVAKINFATIRGKAVLINLTMRNGEVPPMGAEVRDADNTLIGVVGQGGQLYARVPHDSGTLKVNWGESATNTCYVNYQITGRDDEGIIHLNSSCSKE